jgi:hypothetical protein
MSVLLLTPDADGKLQMADVDGNLVGSESDAKHDILLNSGAKMAVDYAKLVEGDVFKLRRGDDKLKVGETIYFKVSGDYQDKNGAKMPQLAQEESEVFYKKKVGFVEKTFKVADDTEATKKEIEAFAKANAGKPTARKLPSYVVLKGRRKE